MTETTFFRLLQANDKGEALANAVAALRAGTPSADVHVVDPQQFRQIPGSPFAYWVSERVRRLFTELDPFETKSRQARRGASTGNDFRRVRAWWEIAPDRVGRQTGWVALSKGGAYSPYYGDVHLLVAWDDARQTFLDFYGRPGRMIEKPEALEYFFRPGLTWPRRTTSGISVRILPPGCIFSDKGPSAFAKPEALPTLLGLMNSGIFEELVALQLGAADKAARSYEVGVVQRTPVPDLSGPEGERLGELALDCFNLKRDLDTANETSHAFILPAVVQERRETLAASITAWGERVATAEEALTRHQAEIDDLAFRLYGLPDEDRLAIEASLGGATDEAEASAPDETEGDEEDRTSVDPGALVDDLISWAIGCAFGRWDVRLALDRSLAPKLQGPFDPLPVCSPGMLVGPDGLPARRGSIASETWLRARPDAITLPEEGTVTQPTISDEDYPLRIDWDGIMVDDEGHPDDIVARVREVLRIVWGERADDIEREACDILDVGDLREYLRQPRHFWDTHVKRYSKSRRRAPIYWLLQSSRRSYSIWLYYHRMDADILYKALRNYVDPKLTLENHRLEELRARLPEAVATGGRVRRDLERAIERQQVLIEEIEEFRKTLEAVALRDLTVDHDDGVLLSIAPLHELVPWRPARQAWDELVAGKYEWSTMAKRMREKGLVRGGRR